MEATPPTKQQLYSYLLPISQTIEARWTRHASETMPWLGSTSLLTACVTPTLWLLHTAWDVTKERKKTSWTKSLKDWTCSQTEGHALLWTFVWLCPSPINMHLLCRIQADHPSFRGTSRLSTYLWLWWFSLINWLHSGLSYPTHDQK